MRAKAKSKDFDAIVAAVIAEILRLSKADESGEAVSEEPIAPAQVVSAPVADEQAAVEYVEAESLEAESLRKKCDELHAKATQLHREIEALTMQRRALLAEIQRETALKYATLSNGRNAI